MTEGDKEFAELFHEVDFSRRDNWSIVAKGIGDYILLLLFIIIYYS